MAKFICPKCMAVHFESKHGRCPKCNLNPPRVYDFSNSDEYLKRVSGKRKFP